MQQYQRQYATPARQDTLQYLINNAKNKFINIVDMETDLQYFQEKDFNIFQHILLILINHGYKCSQDNIDYFIKEIPKIETDDIKTTYQVLLALEKSPSQIKDSDQLQFSIFETFELLEESIFNSQINKYTRKQFIQIGQKLIRLFLQFKQQEQMIGRIITQALGYFNKHLFQLNTPPDISLLTTQMLKEDKFLIAEMRKKVFSVVLSVEIAKEYPLLFRQALQNVEKGESIITFQATSPKKSSKSLPTSPKRKQESPNIKIQTQKLRIAAGLGLERGERDPDAILLVAAFSQSGVTSDQANIGLQTLCSDYESLEPESCAVKALKYLISMSASQSTVKLRSKSTNSQSQSQEQEDNDNDSKVNNQKINSYISQQAQTLLKATHSEKLRIELIRTYGNIMPYKVISERLFDISEKVRKEAFQVLEATNNLQKSGSDLLDDLDFYEKDIHDALIHYYLEVCSDKLPDQVLHLLHKADYKSEKMMVGDVNRQILNLRFLPTNLLQQQIESIAKIKTLSFVQKQRLLLVLSQLQKEYKDLDNENDSQPLDEDQEIQIVNRTNQGSPLKNIRKQNKAPKKQLNQRKKLVNKYRLDVSQLNIKISDFKEVKDKVLYWKCGFSTYEDWKSIYALNSSDTNVLSGVPNFSNKLSSNEIAQLTEVAQKTLKVYDLCIWLDELSNNTNDVNIAKIFKETSYKSNDFKAMVVFLNSKSNVLLDIEYMETFLKTCINYGNNEEVIDELYDKFNIKYVPNVSQKLMAIYFAISVLLQQKNKFYKPFERMLEALKAILDVTFKQTQNEKYTISFVFYYYIFLINHCKEQNINDLKYDLEQFKLFFGPDLQINTQLVQSKLGVKYNATKLAMLQVFDTRITGSNKYPGGVFD